MLKEFRAFVLRGNVVDLAVGVVVGAAFKSIIDALVNGVLNPLLSFASTGNLKDKTLCIGTSAKGVCPHLFQYGEVLSAIISFVLIAAVVFFVVVKPVNHLLARFSREGELPATRECPECLNQVPRAARRCGHCTAVIGVA